MVPIDAVVGLADKFHLGLAAISAPAQIISLLAGLLLGPREIVESVGLLPVLGLAV